MCSRGVLCESEKAQNFCNAVCAGTITSLLAKINSIHGDTKNIFHRNKSHAPLQPAVTRCHLSMTLGTARENSAALRKSAPAPTHRGYELHFAAVMASTAMFRLEHSAIHRHFRGNFGRVGISDGMASPWETVCTSRRFSQPPTFRAARIARPLDQVEQNRAAWWLLQACSDAGPSCIVVVVNRLNRCVCF